MTIPVHPHSAIIYDFAARARAVSEARGQAGKAAANPQPKIPAVDFGSGWYHQAAMQEADPSRKQ